MNNDDLERDLRSQRGPREAGYTPERLPMTPEEGQVATRRPSRLPRAAMLMGAGLAGALAIAIAAGIFSGSGPEVGATNSTSPSAEASSPTPSGCTPQDVAFSAEPWGGAAGSRGTIVTVRLADGRSACRLPEMSASETPPTAVATIQDANGATLVSSAPEVILGVGGRSLLLEPGVSYAFSVVWSNWCGTAPAAPIVLSVMMIGGPGWTPIPVIVPAGGVDPVPPCMGSNAPSSLSLTNLQPQT